MGQIQAGFVQDHQTLVSIISQALGGGQEDTVSAKEPQTIDELNAAFNSVFKNG